MKKTAMISSTALDLPEHREQVMEACLRASIFPKAMEHLPARDADAIKVSLEMVDEADLYIGIYAWRYGHIPDGHELSITEMEFDRAVARGIPILVFTIHDDHPLSRKMVEANESAQEKLAALKDKACKNRGRREFKSPEDLRGEVLHALAAWQQREQNPDQPAAPSFHPPNLIPQAPEAYIAHPYCLLQTQNVIGRQTELNALTDWLTGDKPIRLFNVVAIGGMGKSALTWKWFNDVAPKEKPGLAGRVWWGFYESDAHYENFIIRTLAYAAGLSEADVRQLAPPEREQQLLHHLNSRPFLLVLDGLERILVAYARMDAAYLDDDLDQRTANLIADAYGLPKDVKETYLEKHRLRRCADPRAGRFLQQLARVQQSRIVVSTRLYPAELQTRTAQLLPGCSAVFLKGLCDDDALKLWREFDVSGTSDQLLPLFQAFGNYPLLLRALAGEVADYRPAPGDFDRWRKANPGFNPADELDLKNAKTHVLQYALQGLKERQRKVLHTLAAFRMPTGWATLAALLVADVKIPPSPPFAKGGIGKATMPDGVFTPSEAFDNPQGQAHGDEQVNVQGGVANPAPHGASPNPSGKIANQAELDAILSELEDRGLVGWDRKANRYDLHPIVRGVVWQALDDQGRQGIYRELHGYFDAAPRPPDWRQVETLEDLTPAIELYHSLIGLKRFQEAFEIFRDHLSSAMIWRLSANRQRREWLKCLFDQGLGKLPSLDSAKDRSWVLNGLAQAYKFNGEPARASVLLQQKVEINRRESDAGNLAVGLRNLSYVHCSAGQLHSSRLAASRALVIARERDDRFHEGVCLRWLGFSLAASGQNQDSALALHRSRAIWIERKNQQGEGLDNAYLAQHCLWQNQPEQALPLALSAWDLAQVRRQERDFICAARVHGEAALGLDDLATASERLHHALSRARAVNLVEEELPALTALAELHRRQRDIPAARDCLEQVWDAAEHGPYPLFHANALNVLAQIERDQGNIPAAIAAATRAFELAWCDGPPYAYQFGLDKARQHLKALGSPEPNLPPFDPSKFEPMPDVEINPKDEFYVESP